MAIRKLNILLSYPVRWSEYKILNNYIQNFYDALGRDGFLEGFYYSMNGNKLIMRANQGFDKEWLFFMGASSKQNTRRKYAGGFGEGFKIASLVAYRDFGVLVRIESRDWTLSVTQVMDRVDGKEVSFLAYDIGKRSYEENSILILENIDEEWLKKTEMQINEFYYKGNPHFGECITETDEYAIYRAKSQPNRKRVKGRLFVNYQSRNIIQAHVNNNVQLYYMEEREVDYIQITEAFLMEYPDYKHDIMNFNEYLEIQWKNSLSDSTLRFLLQGLDVEFLLASLIYNVEEKQRYKSKTTAKRYATVIGQFFHFIRKNTNIDNSELYDAISYNRLRENAYMKRMMAYIEKCGQLSGIVELEALSQGDVLRILEWADEQLEREELWYNEDLLTVNSAALKKAMAAIGVKMMLLYGVTYRELRKIRINQYDDMRSTIDINGFEMRLPYNLAIQMKRIKNFLTDNAIHNEDDLLFIVDNAGQPWGDITSSSGIPDYLGPLIGNTSVTSIIKYGISQLLKAGLNDSVIKRMTGASDKLISGCIIQEDADLTRIVNNKLVTVDLYYRF